MGKDDSVLGSIERSKAHLDQILHRSGMTFLVRSDGTILIQRRSPNTTFPGCWDSSSSFHVTFGEIYEQAAIRELKEETGVSATITYLGKFTYRVPPENEMQQYSHVEAMTLSESITRSRLKVHFTQKTKLT